jgi:hypothetical protein
MLSEDIGVSAAPSTPVTLSGKVIQKETGQPLSGVRLTWVATLNGKLLSKARTAKLAEAVSGRAGTFTLALEDEAVEAYRLLGVSPDSSSTIEVVDAGVAAPAYKMKTGPQAGLVIQVELHPKAKPAASGDIKLLSEFLAANRLTSARDLREQLIAPWADSPAASWPVATRLKTLQSLDIAVKDAGVGEDWGRLLDFDKLDAGTLAGSVTGEIFTGAIRDHIGKKSNLRLYRDYLRGVWVNAALFMHGATSSPGDAQPSKATLEKQLDNRLHQNFRTSSEALTSTAALLAEILKPALTVSRDKGGFGKTANQVPAKASSESDDDYLAKLVQLSGVGSSELQKRFRVDFEPDAGARTSRIQLNVDALRGFLSDSFQAPFDPYPISPDARQDRQRPIVLPGFAGSAPFYLQYEEWLDRQQPFYCENAFDIRRTIPVFSAQFREAVQTFMGGRDFDARKAFTEAEQHSVSASDGVGSILVGLFAFTDQLTQSVGQIDQGDYNGALASLADVEVAAQATLKRLLNRYWYKEAFSFQWNSGSEIHRDISLPARAGMPTDSVEALSALEGFFQPPYFLPLNYPSGFDNDTNRIISTLTSATLYVHWLYYVLQVMLPFLRAGIAQATRNYAEACRQLGFLTGNFVGVAEADTADPYDGSSRIFQLESLPYTTTVKYDERSGARKNAYPAASSGIDDRAFSTLKRNLAISPCEWRFFRLAQGRAMLDWAEQLFRTDEPSSIRRARELYKGVLLLHGVEPGTAPSYPKEGSPILVMVTLIGNPAIRAQVARANYGLYLIRQGLNVYGWREDMVPVLRFRPLKDAADSLASAAKAAQNDFIAYTDRFEQAQLDRMYAGLLVEKGKATANIAEEQVAIAQNDVKLAQDQVKAIEKQIEKKQQEIDDHDSLWGQFKDYAGGVKKELEKLTKKDKGSAAGGSEATKGLVAVGGSGAMVLGGLAVFTYVSWLSMETMETEANRRGDEIKRLRDEALPAAQAQVQVRQRGVSIAQYQQQIAQADLQYANALVRFNRDRFLSVETWSKLALVAEQLMGYYVDNAARMGWLSERALAFEQARAIAIIRKNYLPKAMRGLTGPDLLTADLSALENSRLLAIKLTMPVQHTLSLARDFPLAFGALKSTGRCSFVTEEALLRVAYPGLFGFRIRSVSVGCQTTGASLIRGTLRNRGVSSVSVGSGSAEQILIRFPDALPISEFDLKDDMDAFGLPGETLLQFEGSGFTTGWDVALAAGPGAASGLTDMLLTFDGFAFFSDDAFAQPAPPAPSNRAMLFAGSTINAEGVAALREGSSSQLTIDLSDFGEPAAGVRTIANLALIWLGKGPATATLTSGDGTTATATFEDGVAASNAAPFDGFAGAMPLNVFSGTSLDQTFRLDVGSPQLQEVDDIAFLVEYSTVPN